MKFLDLVPKLHVREYGHVSECPVCGVSQTSAGPCSRCNETAELLFQLFVNRTDVYPEQYVLPGTDKGAYRPVHRN